MFALVPSRLQKELMALMMSSEKGVSAFPENENFFRWIGTITGEEARQFTASQFVDWAIFSSPFRRLDFLHTHTETLTECTFVLGPCETVYDGQRYRLLLEFPNTYPYTPPSVTFITKCFHPNVDLNGALCLDILKEKWSALYDVRTILLSIQSLLGEPNNESPLNSQAASMWADQKAYKRYLDTFYEKAIKDEGSA